MKLIYVHNYSSFDCSGEHVIPFEYESKEKFVFDVLEKFKGKKWKEYGAGFYEEVELFLPESKCDILVNEYDVEIIEHNVYTLEEWFEKHQIIIKL